VTAQAERVDVAGLLIAVATALVLLGKLTGDAWASYTQWVIAFVLAHHAVSSGSGGAVLLYQAVTMQIDARNAPTVNNGSLATGSTNSAGRVTSVGRTARRSRLAVH
jgi:hypothetical protein